MSLDSLDEAAFARITRRPYFQKVIDSILTAVEMGFQVKVNVVIARGYNDSELIDFVQFSEKTGVDVRFLELMRVGASVDEHIEKFMAAEEMIEIIAQEFELFPVASVLDSTSFNFKTVSGARIGFIASESQPFCGNCSRLRLSATGKLQSCLFSEAGVELRGVDPLNYPEILHQVMEMKPHGRLPFITQTMNQIGG